MWGNDDLVFPEKKKWLFLLLLHVLRCHRAVYCSKTHLLVFRAPKARRNWHNYQNRICTEKLFQAIPENTASPGERLDSSLARSQMYTNVQWGSQLQSRSRGIFSIILAGQTKALSYPNFQSPLPPPPKSMSLSFWMSEIKPFFPNYSDLFLCLSIGQCFPDHVKEHWCYIRC